MYFDWDLGIYIFKLNCHVEHACFVFMRQFFDMFIWFYSINIHQFFFGWGGGRFLGINIFHFVQNVVLHVIPHFRDFCGKLGFIFHTEQKGQTQT